MAGLDEYRKEIDDIDKELTKLFEKRMDVVLKVARYKQENNLNVLQKGREDDVLNKAVANLTNKDYSDAVVKFLNATMEISRELQKKTIDKSTGENRYKVTRAAINKKK